MNLKFLLTIFLTIWTMAKSKEVPGSSKPSKRHSPIISLLKNSHPKTLLIKRSPGRSSSLPALDSTRILNNKTPLNVLQNGPYYINHYIYCDNLDEHTLDQIKSGTFSSNKEIQLLNLNKGDFHTVGGFTGDKEFHVLHLPKDKNSNFGDGNLELSLLNGHETSKAPEIDLELNKHLGNFEVNLGDIQPPNLDTSLLHTTANEIVTPLIQGQITGGQNHKHNTNLIQIADYLNLQSEKEHTTLGSFDTDYNTDKRGEILELPHFEQHPLEHDPSQNSYDTPGAIDSYGNPATQSYSPQNPHSHFNAATGQPNLAHLIPTEQYGTGSFSNGFHNIDNSLNKGIGYNFKGTDLYQSENYINQLNEINGLQRRRRMDAYQKSSNTENSESEKATINEIRYPNHKYD